MAFNKGETVFFAFKNGRTVLDSQLRPRMYKTINQAKRSYPSWFAGEAELVEYAPVKHGRWISDDGDILFHCSRCETQISTSWDYDCAEMWEFCPHCGAAMTEEAMEILRKRKDGSDNG